MLSTSETAEFPDAERAPGYVSVMRKLPATDADNRRRPDPSSTARHFNEPYIKHKLTKVTRIAGAN